MTKKKTSRPSKRGTASRLPLSVDKRSADVAIVGMGGRFPQAKNLTEFWANLLAEKSAITQMPAARRSISKEGQANDQAASAPQVWGGFIDDVECFDAAFFGISPKEADLMDPQQRLLLEVVWHTLEDARIKPSTITGSNTGVFIGACNVDYSELLDAAIPEAGLLGITGTFGSILSNRVSYVFDWRGPSFTVDTACSSSLVAVHLAAKAIQGGECELAIAGGVNVCWTSKRFIAFSDGGMLSKDGRCRPFDAHANGYVRGEGIGVLLLKPLQLAIRDGNTVHGVIKGSAINHGGKTRGLTVTSPAQQSRLLTDVYRSAGVHPETVGYIETHSTGMVLGDPIEVLALKSAFETLCKERGGASSAPNYCGLGSVKTNIGHLEAAAGIAGLIKVLLALRHKIIPATLNVNELNPLITLEGSPFYIQASSKYWQPSFHNKKQLRRVAGVSSFGFGGACAHVILEEYASTPPRLESKSEGLQLVVLSARTLSDLQAYASALLEHMQRLCSNEPGALRALAYSSQTTREELEERVAFIVSNNADLVQKLQYFIKGKDNVDGCFLGRMQKKKTVADNKFAVDEPTDRHALAAVAQKWVMGQPIDWRSLYTQQDVSPIEFPFYPFAKHRHWVPQVEVRNLTSTDQSRHSQLHALSLHITLNENINKASLLENVLDALTLAISKQLQTNVDEIDVNSELSTLGLDSVGLTTFSDTLNEKYGLNLSPTIFFAHTTVRRLAEYLVDEHAPLLTAKPLEKAARTAIKSDEPAATSAPTNDRPAKSFVRQRHLGSLFILDNPIYRQRPNSEPIAIVGLSGCFPGASGVDELWENLKTGKESITEIPASRWNWRAIYGDPLSDANRTNIKWGGFIEGVDEFDALFFNISPKEAELMDPQQRLLMTYTWKAIEDAGYAPRSLSGSQTGVFVGTASSGYSELIAQANVAIEGYSSTGTVPSVGPNRISYLLNLHGPSEPIETACSSSLVAIHRAVRAMQSGDCKAALVGGINLIITPWAHISYSKAGMLSEDGRCKTFSKAANGYVRGEGVAMLFLKPLSVAEADADHIYALIRGSSENHGGRANTLTAPNPKAQAELIKAAYREARIDPRTVTYIETHGSGTPLGDPIEIDGLKNAFEDLYFETEPSATHVDKQAHCGIGSVKTNIGHLELAAGIAGVIKVLLQLKHKTLAPSLHCDEMNPYIQLQGSPFYVVKELQPWPASQDDRGQELPRRAGVSSFGFGGVNAHVILEEYRESQASPQQPLVPAHPALIVLSTKNKERMQEQVNQLLTHVGLHAYTDDDLVSIAYTLQIGRDEMDYRLAFTATTISELQAKLAGYMEGKVEEGVIAGCYVGAVEKNRGGIDLNADEVLQTVIAARVDTGRYGKLLGQWIKGLPIDWITLYGEQSAYQTVPSRISLPTYPFARELCWIKRAVGSQSKKIEAEQKATRESAWLNDDPWLKVTERWMIAPLVTEVQSWSVIERNMGAQRVLILYRRHCDVENLRKALARAWAENANRLLVDAVCLPECSKADEAWLLDDYLATHRAPDAVFYFSGVIEDLASMSHELQCVLRTSQTFIARAGSKSIRFYYCYPAAESQIRLYQEGLSGLFRAIAHECPAHRYHSVEYSDSASSQDYVAMVREWLQPLPAVLVAAQQPMVRYRDGQRYVTTLVELNRTNAPAPSAEFRRGVTYLIVGGLGELGQLICCALAHAYQSRLVILSRRPIDTDIQQRIDQIMEAGSEVIYRSVDITDEDRLIDVVSEIKVEVGAIHGVLHLARAVSDGPLQDKSFVSFRQTIAAKVEGMLNVDRVTVDQPLEFFMVYSSMASFGIEGSADYGYATAFQNAFVRERNRQVELRERSGKSLALCWGQWEADAYSNAQRDSVIKKSGLDLIPLTSAVWLMSASLQEQDEVIGIMAVTDRQQVKRRYGLSVQVPLSKSATNEVAEGSLPDVHSVVELLRASKNGNRNFDAVEGMLRDQPYGQLVELYDTLTH